MKLYLIRHAKSIDAENGVSQRDDTPIDTDTISSNLYKDLNPNKVYSSSLLRAKQTAEKLFVNYEVLDYIHEFIRPKFLDGKTKIEAERFWETSLINYRKDADWKYDGSESFNEVKMRAQKLLIFLRKQPYEKIAIVGHGIFFRHLIGVNAAGDCYNQKISLDGLRYISWDNLEMKEIDINS